MLLLLLYNVQVVIC